MKNVVEKIMLGLKRRFHLAYGNVLISLTFCCGGDDGGVWLWVVFFSFV